MIEGEPSSIDEEETIDNEETEDFQRHGSEETSIIKLKIGIDYFDSIKLSLVILAAGGAAAIALSQTNQKSDTPPEPTPFRIDIRSFDNSINQLPQITPAPNTY